MSYYEFIVYKRLFTAIGEYLKGGAVTMKHTSAPIEMVANLYGVSDHISESMWYTTYGEEDEKEYILLGFGKDDYIKTVIFEDFIYQCSRVRVIILPSKNIYDNMTNDQVIQNMIYISTMVAGSDNKITPIREMSNYVICCYFVSKALSVAYKITESFEELIFRNFGYDDEESESLKTYFKAALGSLSSITRDSFETCDYLSEDFMKFFIPEVNKLEMEDEDDSDTLQ